MDRWADNAKLSICALIRRNEWARHNERWAASLLCFILLKGSNIRRTENRICNTFFLFVRKEGGGHLAQTWIFFSCVFLPSLPESKQGHPLVSHSVQRCWQRACSHGKAVSFWRGQFPPNEEHYLFEIQIVHEMGKTPSSSSNSILSLLPLQAGYKTCGRPWRKALANVSETLLESQQTHMLLPKE